MKLCKICNQTKERSFFYKKTSSKDGLYPYCKKCTQEKNKKYYPENKDKFLNNSRKYQYNNRELLCQKEREYRLANPDKKAAKQSKRRCSKLLATPSWANEFFIKEIYHLAALRTKVIGYLWHVDHVIPLKHPLVCGLHVENNLQIIPAKDNLTKSNKFSI